jgi:nickel-dependent lactate racemase
VAPSIGVEWELFQAVSYQISGSGSNVASKTQSCTSAITLMPAKPQEMTSIRFGADCQWALAGKLRHAKPVPPLADLRSSLSHAMESPIGLPSLDQLIVPGDTIALAIDPALPELPAIVGFAVQWIHEKGTELASIKVVLASKLESLKSETLASLAAIGLGDVEVELHDADDDQAVAYVAANEESDPIYINRTLVDADVVLPITCAKLASSLDYLGGYSIFPLLSNRQTLTEFYKPSRIDDAAEHAKLIAWADQAAWWLGLLAAIQVIPAEENRVASILAGLTEPLEAAAQEEFAKRWKTEDEPSDLVIALLDGSQAQQSWHQVARALRNATRYVTQGGSIALCTQVSDPAGKGLRRLRDPHRTEEEIAAKLASDTSDDALPASVILETTRDYHVYFSSELRRDTVESLRMGVLENEAQLSNLVGQHATSIVLSSAQHRS